MNVETGKLEPETISMKLRRKWRDWRYRCFLKKHPDHGLFKGQPVVDQINAKLDEMKRARKSMGQWIDDYDKLDDALRIALEHEKECHGNDYQFECETFKETIAEALGISNPSEQ